MPPKRKNDDAGEPSARERKKLKRADARTISVQETSAASGSAPTNNQENAVASSSKAPSKTTIQFDCTYSEIPFCRSPTLDGVHSYAGFASFYRRGEVHGGMFVPPFNIAVTKDRLGACVRDQCNAEGNKDSWACHQGTLNSSFLTMFSSESSRHRAWQTLPRHLRRRAASHDVRRVPVRLRDKSRAEVSLS